MVYIALRNEKADRRLERHPYSVAELGLLLAAAEAGPMVHGMIGMDRALLYRSAVDTGFRWGELYSLERASFDFRADPATVTIEAAYAKNGQEDTLPLRSELAADLERRMALFLPTAKAFPGMWQDRGAEMIRVDLEAAGILKRDANNELIIKDAYGRVYDFHGLRHTFATFLNQARIPLATAQKLMRHSDPKLTANIYTHVMVEGKAEALAKLPEIAPMTPASEAAAKTGTDDASFLQVRNSADRPGDSNGSDFDRQTTTYSDDENDANVISFAMSGNEKTLWDRVFWRKGRYFNRDISD